MKYYELYQGESRNTQIQQPEWNDQYDVIVAGAGSSGIYCAVAAADEGKRVLLIEKSAWCGGMHVQGMVNGYYYGCRGGLYEEIDRKSQEIADDVFYNVTDAKRLVIGKMLREHNVTVFTSSLAIGVFAQEQTVVGIRTLLGTKAVAIGCKMLVDATSDGHVLRMLPVKTHIGRDWDHAVQPFSSVRCVYLDQDQYDGGLRVSAGKLSGRYSVYHEYRDNGYVNQYDETAYTDSIINAHASHLKTLAPKARFLYLPPLIGVREGVLYEGEQTLTLKDVLEGQTNSENTLLYSFCDIDKHGADTAFDDEAYQNWFVNCNMSTCTIYIPIPIGTLIPKGWKGFITSGRCLATDSYLNSAIRVNVDAFRRGEACGVLAALAVDAGQDAMSVPYDVLCEKMEGRGLLEGQKERRPSFWTPAHGDDRKFVVWMTDLSEIKAALTTNCPGVALWSCHLLGKEVIGDKIFEFTKSEDELLRYNAAIALGVMHDERAVPLLHEIIKRRKPFYYMDCRRSNQMRSVVAICLCGQMGSKAVMDELLQIIQPEEYDKPMYHELLEPCYQLSIVNELNSVYFQHFSHAVASLVKIAKAHPECRDAITSALHNALDDETYIRRMTGESEGNAYYQAALNCKRYVQNMLY